MRCAILFLLCCSPSTAVQDVEPVPVQKVQPIEFAPRAAVAGMRLISASSTLRFDGAEDRPHQLVATYLFPDRARWSLRAIGQANERGSRRLRYRAGEQCFSLSPGESVSESLVEYDLHQALLQMELRRATLLWPDGFDWQSDGTARVAAVPGHGSLRAEFAKDAGESGRPVRFASFFEDGAPCERFEAVRWSAESRWPTALELWLGETRVWTEVIDEVVHRGDFLDCFFIPADRRVTVAASLGSIEVHHFDLPLRAVRRRAIEPAQPDLAAARKSSIEAAERWNAELHELGAEAAVQASLELDEQGAACAILARVDAPLEVPSAWGANVVADGPALVRSLPSFGPVDRRLLRALRESRPRGSEAGAFELRWDAQGGARVLLPLLPSPRSER